MIKKFLAVLLTVLFPAYLHAAIVRGTTTSSSGADDLTFAHTVDAGSNLGLAIVCHQEGTKGWTATYAGVNVPSVVSLGHSVSQAKTEIFFLANPATGTNNVIVDIATADDIACIAINYTGVLQATPTSGAESAEFSSDTDGSSVSVTCAAGNAYLSGIGAISAATFTAGGETAEILQVDIAAFSMSTSEDSTPDGTVDGTWTWGGTTESGTHVGICINAAADAVPGSIIWFR